MSDLLAWTLIGACGLLGYCLVYLLLKKQRVAPSSKAECSGQEEWHDDVTMPTKPWHEVLEVSPTCSPDELREAYRKKLMQYHPDRVFSLGPEFRNLANQRMKAINEAFAVAKQKIM